MAVLEGVRFIEEIEAGLKAPGRNLAEHPLIEKINRRELTRNQLKGMMVQVTLQTRDIVRWLGTLYGDCPYKDVRRKVFLNLLEEELGAVSVRLSQPDAYQDHTAVAEDGHRHQQLQVELAHLYREWERRVG